MNYKSIAISLLLLCFTVLWGQEEERSFREKGFPSAALFIYKRVKDPLTGKEINKRIGKSKAEILQNLGQPDGISRYDNDEGEYWRYSDGLTIGYTDYVDPSLGTYDMLSIKPNYDGSENPYMLGGAGYFLLEFGESIYLWLHQYKYSAYLKGDQSLSRSAERALPDHVWRQYVFDIVTPDGTLSDAGLVIDVQNNKIIKIWIGMAE